MAEPDLGAPARHLRRFDSDLFATALFAREPGRGRLMTLYAFDVELSRSADPAQGSDAGPLIAAMRLQWWRDRLAAAAAGAAEPAHDIAGPLHRLVTDGYLAADALEPMIDARDIEVSGTTAEAFDSWADARFGGLVSAAAALLGDLDPGLGRLAGGALARAYAVRTFAPMRARGSTPVGVPEQADPVGAIARLARDGIGLMAETRRAMRLTQPAPVVRPALLPLWRANRDLRRATRDPAGAARDLPAPSPARRAAGLTWAALTGRI